MLTAMVTMICDEDIDEKDNDDYVTNDCIVIQCNNKNSNKRVCGNLKMILMVILLVLTDRL